MTGKNVSNFAYVMSKITHMRRLGVVYGNHVQYSRRDMVQRVINSMAD